MRFFISGDLPEPTDAELRAFFEVNTDRFTSPQSFDVDHVMFNPDSDVPPDILEELNNGADPSGVGDTDLSTGQILRFMDQRRLVQALGGETARQVLDALQEDNTWHGPFAAPVGTVHFLFVIKENQPRLPDSDNARDWIAAQWLSDKSRELMDQELLRIEQEYRIDVEPLAEAASNV